MWKEIKASRDTHSTDKTIKKNKAVFNGSPLQYSCLENPMDGGAW